MSDDEDLRTLSWRELIAVGMKHQGETWDDVVSHTLMPKELDEQFYYEYGAQSDIANLAWTVWTQMRVYFPLVYDGLRSVGSAPRHPGDERTESQP